MGLNFLLVEVATTLPVIGLETAVTVCFDPCFLRFLLEAAFWDPVAARMTPVNATNKRVRWKISRARFFIDGFLAMRLNR